MIGAIVFFVLLFGYFGIVKGESDSLKVFLAIIGIVAVVWLIGSFSNDNNGMTDADYEKIRIYEENHKGRKKTYATYEEAVDIICGRNKKRIENEIEKSLGKIPMCAHEAIIECMKKIMR